MKTKTHQPTIFDYKSPPVIPNFGGDFEKEMDFIKNLPEEDLWCAFNAFKEEDVKKE